MPNLDPSELFDDPVSAITVVVISLVAIGLFVWNGDNARATIHNRIDRTQNQVQDNEEQIDENEKMYQKILRRLTRIDCRLNPDDCRSITLDSKDE